MKILRGTSDLSVATGLLTGFLTSVNLSHTDISILHCNLIIMNAFHVKFGLISLHKQDLLPMLSVRKSLAFSFAEKYSSMAIQFISTIVLARLLTPEEIGIYSLGAVIIGFAHMLRDFGVSNYLIQEKELTKDRIRTAFGVTLIIAWLISIVLISFSEMISNFYSEPQVKTVIRLLCISLFFIPINATIIGLLRRKMAFQTLFAISLPSTIVHTIVGISLAYLGFGFESLAWASVASAATTLISGLILKPPESQFWPSLKEFKRIFIFGSSSSAASLLAEAGLSAPDLTISKFLSFSQLGFYSRALGLVSIFNYAVTAAIRPVVLPAFSQAIREKKLLSSIYLSAISNLTAVSWPFFCFLSIMTLPVIRLLYGDQWDDSLRSAQLLCAAFALQALTAFSSPALIAMSLINVNLRILALIQLPRIALTVGASFYSIEHVAFVQVVFYAFSFIAFHKSLHKKLGIKLLDIFQVTIKSFYVAVGSCVVPLIIMTNITTYNNFMLLTISGTIWFIGYLFFIFKFSHPIKTEFINIYESAKVVISPIFIRFR